jgi:hypothetical protein
MDTKGHNSLKISDVVMMGSGHIQLQYHLLGIVGILDSEYDLKKARVSRERRFGG